MISWYFIIFKISLINLLDVNKVTTSAKPVSSPKQIYYSRGGHLSTDTRISLTGPEPFKWPPETTYIWLFDIKKLYDKKGRQQFCWYSMWYCDISASLTLNQYYMSFIKDPFLKHQPVSAYLIQLSGRSSFSR